MDAAAASDAMGLRQKGWSAGCSARLRVRASGASPSPSPSSLNTVVDFQWGVQRVPTSSGFTCNPRQWKRPHASYGGRLAPSGRVRLCARACVPEGQPFCFFGGGSKGASSSSLHCIVYPPPRPPSPVRSSRSPPRTNTHSLSFSKSPSSSSPAGKHHTTHIHTCTRTQHELLRGATRQQEGAHHHGMRLWHAQQQAGGCGWQPRRTEAKRGKQHPRGAAAAAGRCPRSVWR